MDQTRSFTSCTTVYHSFNDVELFEPASPPQRRQSAASSSSSRHGATSYGQGQSSAHRPSSQDNRDSPSSRHQMKRQDSGYESHVSTPRASLSPTGSRPVARRTSTSAMSTATSKPRCRATARRFVNCHNPPRTLPQRPTSLYIVRSPASHASTSTAATTSLEMSSYVHFPSPDSADAEHGGAVVPLSGEVQHPPPPQTTHYWTSDRTRRLEYAAIDAASQGFKGWVKRNILPDCFFAKDDGHIAFDDDTGSVRRYRLELEDDPPPLPGLEKKQTMLTSAVPRRVRTWPFWSSISSQQLPGH